jgi:hypothetical protein
VKQTVPLYLDDRQVGTADVDRNERGEVLGSGLRFFDPADEAEFYRRSREGNRRFSVGFVDERAARLARETTLSYSEAAGLLDAMPPGTSVEDAARVAVAAHGLGVSPRSLAMPPSFPANDAAARQALASFVDSVKADRRRARNKRKAARRAERGLKQKPRGTRQRVAGLCRLLAREERPR